MNKLILQQFGNKIRQERGRLGLSQETLGEKAGLHRTYIGMIERAEKNITLLNIAKLADALGVTVSSLLEADGQIPYRPNLPNNTKADLASQDWGAVRKTSSKAGN